MTSVQRAFSLAIKRRDRICRVRDYEPCSGSLECSHFHTQGSSPTLMFYPPNAVCQCSYHHWKHHNGKKNFYAEWMSENMKDELEFMTWARHRVIKYTKELQRKIIRLCNEDRLEELRLLIRSEIR